MDPVSLTLGIAGILGSVLHGCTRLRELVKTIRDAPREVLAVREDIDELSRILLLILDFYQQGKVPDKLVGPLIESLDNCIKRIVKTETYLKGFIRTTRDSTVNKWSKVSWTLNKSDVKEIQTQLQQHKANLNIFVTIFNVIQADRNHGLLSQQIDKLEEDMIKRDSDKVHLASVIGDRGSRAATTDVNFAMRRFFDALPPPDHEWVAGSEISINSGDTIRAYVEEDKDDDTLSIGGLPVLNGIELPLNYSLSPFHRAVIADNQELVIALLSSGADVNERSALDFTALHFAADLENAEMATLLLRHGADVHATEKEGRTALQWALSNLSADLVSRLIDVGDDLQAIWDHLLNPPEYAGEEERWKLCLRIVARVAKVQAEANGDVLEMLHMAVKEKQASIVKVLLQEGYDPNTMDNHGLIPIPHAACVHGLDEVELLLKHGANIDATTSTGCQVHPDSAGLGRTALHLAAVTGDAEMLQSLIDCGANVNFLDLSGGNALQALRVHDLSCARILLDAGVEVNNHKYDGQSPLYRAVMYDNAPMIELLIVRGAVIRSPTSNDETNLLTVAAENGRYEALCALLDIGKVNPNVQTLAGWTPLHGAVFSGQLRIVQRLFRAGAVYWKGHKRESPLTLARRLGKEDIVEYLQMAIRRCETQFETELGLTFLPTISENGDGDRYDIQDTANSEGGIVSPASSSASDDIPVSPAPRWETSDLVKTRAPVRRRNTRFPVKVSNSGSQGWAQH